MPRRTDHLSTLIALLSGALFVITAGAQAQGARGSGDNPLVRVSDLDIELPKQIQRKGDGGLMLLVPAGEFFRGSNNPERSGGDPDEAPIRNIYLNTYYIDQFEVTNEQYNLFVTKTKTQPGPYMKLPGYDAPGQPVLGLTWEEANAYARWVGGRLPTEAEWERAARGVDGRLYPWGNTLEGGEANTRGNRRASGPDKVGTNQKDRSPVGCFDMGGNAAEWTQDWYDEGYYAVSDERNPAGPTIPTGMKTIRGGSFEFDPDKARTISRIAEDPETGRSSYGFRVVIVPQQAKAGDKSSIRLTTFEVEEKLKETPVEKLWEDFERVFQGTFEAHRPLPQRLSTTIAEAFPAQSRRDVNFVNLTDANMYLCIVSSNREVVVYDEAIRRSSVQNFRLPMKEQFRTYAIWQDETPEVEKLGILEIPPGNDEYYVVAGLDGRFDEGKDPLRLNDSSVDSLTRELALVNRSPKYVLFTVSDMESPHYEVVLKTELAPNSYDIVRLPAGKYRTVVRYRDQKGVFEVGEIFTFSRDTTRHTVVAAPLPGPVTDFPPLNIERSVYLP